MRKVQSPTSDAIPWSSDRTKEIEKCPAKKWLFAELKTPVSQIANPFPTSKLILVKLQVFRTHAGTALLKGAKRVKLHQKFYVIHPCCSAHQERF